MKGTQTSCRSPNSGGQLMYKHLATPLCTEYSHSSRIYAWELFNFACAQRFLFLFKVRLNEKTKRQSPDDLWVMFGSCAQLQVRNNSVDWCAADNGLRIYIGFVHSPNIPSKPIQLHAVGTYHVCYKGLTRRYSRCRADRQLWCRF